MGFPIEITHQNLDILRVKIRRTPFSWQGDKEVCYIKILMTIRISPIPLLLNEEEASLPQKAAAALRPKRSRNSGF
jgi:hypothetical protein